MGQKEVFLLLKELGGRAKTKEISLLARKKYPNQTMYHYVYQALQQLEKWGYVKRFPDGTYEIAQELDY